MRSSLNGLCIRFAGSVLLALSAGACQARDTQVGSVCPNGVCQLNEGPEGLACSFSGTTAEIVLDGLLGTEEFNVCLPGHLPVDGAGLVACDVLMELPGDAPRPAHCAEPRALASARLESAPNVCFARQLSFEDRAEGAALGWYYREDDPRGECVGPGTAIHVTPGTIPDMSTVLLSCARAQTVDDDATLAEVMPGECRLPNASAGSRDVGKACMPAVVPENGFDDREARVETGATECASDACVVFRLRGDPRPECVARPPSAAEGDPGVACVSGDEVSQRVYCSCRCRGAEGDPGPFCDCPDDFACVDLLDNAPPGVRGGYCIRNGTHTTGP